MRINQSVETRLAAPPVSTGKLVRFLLALVMGCSPACSRRDFLTRHLAADLISASEPFKAPQTFRLQTGIVSNRDFNSPDSMVLQRRGWIIGTQQVCPAGVDPPPCWDVVLSPLGVGAFQPLLSGTSLGAGPMSVRVAGRQLVEVTGISKSGRFADVDFTWRWVALNPVGAALNDEGVRYRSTVEFRDYDDGWRLVIGPEKSSQSLEDALSNAEPTTP
jgi:hypothetical protein